MVCTLALFQVGWFSSLNWKLSWQVALVGVSLLLAVVWAWLKMQRPATGTLCWDGQQWQWSGFSDDVCQLERHLDFQALMLVSLHRPSDRPVWMWLQRSHDLYQWLALRRAVVYATAPGQTHRTRGSVPTRQVVIP